MDTQVTKNLSFFFATICSLASKLALLENEALTKAIEEIMQAYRELDNNDVLDTPQHDETKEKHSSPLFGNAIFSDKTLSPVDKCVYSVLYSLADKETRQCSPTVATIAEFAPCSPRAVHRSLDTLEKHGAIQRTHRFRNHRQISSLYKITDYKPADDSGQDNTADNANNTADTAADIADITAENEHTADTESNVAYSADYHPNTVDDNNHSANSPSACQSVVTMQGWQSVVMTPDWQSIPTQNLQTKDSFKIFKESLREGGASLPAIAEKKS